MGHCVDFDGLCDHDWSGGLPGAWCPEDGGSTHGLRFRWSQLSSPGSRFSWLMNTWGARNGGYVEITDLGDDGKPVRQSRLEMLFYGSRTTHRAEHSREMIVASKRNDVGGRLFQQYESECARSPTICLRRRGGQLCWSIPGQLSHFPDSAAVVASV